MNRPKTRADWNTQRAPRLMWLSTAILSLAMGGAPLGAVEEGSKALPAGAPGRSGQPHAPPEPIELVHAEEMDTEPQRISMDFKDASLKTVLKTFSQETGLNVIASEEIGDQAITLYLDEVTAMDALDRILGAAGLAYERPPGSQIYVVTPKPKHDEPPEARMVTRVYRLKFARVSTSRLAKAAEALISQTPFEAARTTSAAVTGGGTGGTGGQSGGSSAGFGVGLGAGSEEEVGIDKVLEQLLSSQGKLVVDARTNSLVVTDVPANLARIESVLNALDVRTAQILIEAEVLETTLDKAKKLGIKWGGGNTSVPSELVTLTPGGGKTRFPFAGLGTSAPTFSGTNVPNFDLSTLSAAGFKGALQALETDTDTKILARPKVLTLDNESALIRLSSQQAVGFQTVTAGTQTTSTQTATPERITTGVILVVTPQVNEGGFITMLVEPSITKVVASTLTPPSNLGNKVLDPKTRSARAMVRIRQGETLVLGGLIDRSDEATVQRVPILSGIPIIGEAFKEKETTRAATELMVFITPRLLDEPEGEESAAEAASRTPMGAREQEPTQSRRDVIEDRLNVLEREQRQ